MNTNNHARKAAIKACIYGMEHIMKDNEVNSDYRYVGGNRQDVIAA